MPSVSTFNAQTAASVRSAAANSVNELFSGLLNRGCLATGDVFSAFEGGMGQMGYPICRVQDLTKTQGETVHFTRHSGLGAKPILGESTLRGNEEPMTFGTHQVRLDFVRNGTSSTRKQLRIMAAGRSIPEAQADELVNWFGRIRTDFVMQRWIQRAVAGHNIFYPNNKSSINALAAADDMSPTVIDRAAARLASLGGKPIAKKLSSAGATINQFLFFGPNDVLQALKGDSAYLNRAYYAEERGGSNSLTTGNFVDWNGNKIFHWNVVDDDVDGPIGSFFNPKAIVGEAIAAGTGAVTIRGGGSRYSSSATPTRDYFRYFFGNIAFKQYEDESIGADSTVYYLKIYVLTGADAGKYAFCSYTGSTGNTGFAITTTQKLGATAAGTTVTTLGGITYDSAVHVNMHGGTTIPVGSIIYQANDDAQVIGYCAALGSESCLIAYGGGAMGDPQSSFAGSTNYRPRSAGSHARIFNDVDDYGMKLSASVEGVMGVDVVKDTVGSPRNFILIPTVYIPPEAVA